MMNIVVVEDSEEIAMLLKMILSHEPDADVLLRTSRFSTVHEDVEWSDVDVVVCDRLLEDYYGEALLKWLEEHHPRIRRVMLTGSVNFTEEQAHAHRVLIKPVPADVLVQAVRNDR